MFIINLTYIAALCDIDNYMEEHKKFLDKYYNSGNFLLSGRKVPRTGGMILARFNSAIQVNEIIKEDPFYKANLATYDIIELQPTKFSEKLQSLFSIGDNL